MKKKAFDITDIQLSSDSITDFFNSTEDEDMDITSRSASKKGRQTPEDKILAILFAPDSPLSGNRKARKAATKKVFKVHKLSDLKGFTRVANTNTLVRVSEQDFWTLRQAEDGSYEIERLVDEDGNPVKVGK